MKTFLEKLTAFSLSGAIPIMILLGVGYLYYDPFRVLKEYDSYSYPTIAFNRDNVSTQTFRKNYQKEKYNSFIFGSSRTLAFKPDSWRRYLRKSDKPFMFDASRESLYGIYNKLRYLESQHVKLDNAIILLCRDASFEYTSNHKGLLFVKHPLVTGESYLKFHLIFLRAYLDLKFIRSFYTYLFTKEYEPYMSGYIETKQISINPITNAYALASNEAEIQLNSDKYYKNMKAVFYQRTGLHTDTVQRIETKHLFFLNEIKRILEKNKTNYKVVLSPLYEQVKFNEKDLVVLKRIFEKNLYDFSGRNPYSEQKTNFYENSHFRPHVGDSILATIYE